MKYPLHKPDLSQFEKFVVALPFRQQLYIALQFVAYVALGSYLLNLGETLPPQALIVGWGYMGLGLFVLGAGLENRPWALKLEWLRLALNLPLGWLAPWVGLWPASALGWAGLFSYSVLSLIGLYLCRGRFTQLAGC